MFHRCCCLKIALPQLITIFQLSGQIFCSKACIANRDYCRCQVQQLVSRPGKTFLSYPLLSAQPHEIIPGFQHCSVLPPSSDLIHHKYKFNAASSSPSKGIIFKSGACNKQLFSHKSIRRKVQIWHLRAASFQAVSLAGTQRNNHIRVPANKYWRSKAQTKQFLQTPLGLLLQLLITEELNANDVGLAKIRKISSGKNSIK